MAVLSLTVIQLAGSIFHLIRTSLVETFSYFVLLYERSPGDVCDSQVLSLLGRALRSWSRTEAEGMRGRSNSTGEPMGCTNCL